MPTEHELPMLCCNQYRYMKGIQTNNRKEALLLYMALRGPQNNARLVLMCVFQK